MALFISNNERQKASNACHTVILFAVHMHNSWATFLAGTENVCKNVVPVWNELF